MKPLGGRHVVLIRGINVGRAKRVAMTDLRKLLQDLGFANARTLLNSGNVVVDVPIGLEGSLGPRVEAAMAERLGVSAKAVVLSAEELAEAIAENPLIEAMNDPSRLLVMVFERPEDMAGLEAAAGEEWSPEALAIGRRVAYLWCAKGILDSRLVPAVGRAVGAAGTSRNWSTMLKLKALTET